MLFYDARTQRNRGAIAYSKSTANYGYASDSGRAVTTKALKSCDAPDAAIIALEADLFMAPASSVEQH